MPITNQELLRAALIGFEQQLSQINVQIAEIRVRLGAAAPKKRTMSLAARRRIAAAQRKRWAATKAKPAKPKRTLSAAGRKAIIEGTRKRWAAFHKAAAKKAKQ